MSPSEKFSANNTAFLLNVAARMAMDSIDLLKTVDGQLVIEFVIYIWLNNGSFIRK